MEEAIDVSGSASASSNPGRYSFLVGKDMVADINKRTVMWARRELIAPTRDFLLLRRLQNYGDSLAHAATTNQKKSKGSVCGRLSDIKSKSQTTAE
jgi:hypothetical protein